MLAEYLQLNMNVMHWYKGELLLLAKDIGFRLLPAFNTTTGIPHARVCNINDQIQIKNENNSNELVLVMFMI